MTNLRWFKKDGQEPVLQENISHSLHEPEWVDVVTVEEEKKKQRMVWVSFDKDIRVSYVEPNSWPDKQWILVVEPRQ